MTTKLCHSKSNYIKVARPRFPTSLPLANAILPQQYGKTCLTATQKSLFPLSRHTSCRCWVLSGTQDRCCPAVSITSLTSAKTTAPCYAARRGSLVSHHLCLDAPDGDVNTEKDLLDLHSSNHPVPSSWHQPGFCPTSPH